MLWESWPIYTPLTSSDCYGNGVTSSSESQRDTHTHTHRESVHYLIFWQNLCITERAAINSGITGFNGFLPLNGVLTTKEDSSVSLSSIDSISCQTRSHLLDYQVPNFMLLAYLLTFSFVHSLIHSLSRLLTHVFTCSSTQSECSHFDRAAIGDRFQRDNENRRKLSLSRLGKLCFDHQGVCWQKKRPRQQKKYRLHSWEQSRWNCINKMAEQNEDTAVQDFLEILEEHRKNCERQGKYVEAEIAKNRLEELKLHEENRRRVSTKYYI